MGCCHSNQVQPVKKQELHPKIYINPNRETRLASKAPNTSQNSKFKAGQQLFDVPVFTRSNFQRGTVKSQLS